MYTLCIMYVYIYKMCALLYILADCGLVAAYGVTDPGQYWLVKVMACCSGYPVMTLIYADVLSFKL